MRFFAYDAAGVILLDAIFYSVGGGFVLSDAEADQQGSSAEPAVQVPYHFNNGEELLELCESNNMTIAELVQKNELAYHDQETVTAKLRQIWGVMDACIKRGCNEKGDLPGGLDLKRRAPVLYQELQGDSQAALQDQLAVIDWVNLFAIAVNEENAAGGRVVTAPTNGAAGVIPAVLAYYDRFVPGASERASLTFWLRQQPLACCIKECLYIGSRSGLSG